MPSMPNRRVVPWIAPVLAGTVPVATALLVWLGPEPSVPTQGSQLRPDALPRALSEPTDRLVVLVWWLIALAGAVVVAILLKGRHADRFTGAGSDRWPRVLPWLLGPGLVLLGVSVLWHWDSDNRSPDIGLPGLALGLVLAVGALIVMARAARASSLVLGAGAVTALAVFAPAWWQTTDRIADLGHATYTLDEVASVASGHFPLIDYVSQYTNLLAYPIAPIIRLFPGAVVGVTLGWLVLLQLACVVIAISMVGWQSGRRAAGLAAVIVPALLFAEGAPGNTPAGYFGATPMRLIIPVCLFALAAILIARDSRLRRRSPVWGLLLVGFVGGLAVLNNPDFGSAALIAVLVMLLCVGRSWADRGRGVGVALAGALLPFVIYTGASAAAGTPARWSDWLLYQRLFGADGFMNVPMPVLGWHVAAAVLFIAAALIGLAGVITHRTTLHARAGRRSVVLLMVGSWGVLTLPYYAGRSMASTVMGGYALQIGWVVASLLPLVAAGAQVAVRRYRGRASVAGATSVMLGVVAIAFCLAGLLRVPAPGDLANREVPPLLKDQSAAWEAVLPVAPADFTAALGQGRVRQLLASPSVTAFTLGVPSASVFNTPEVLGLSAAFASRQCEALKGSPAAFLVVPSAYAAAIGSDTTCQQVLATESPLGLTVPGSKNGPAFTVIPFREQRR